jgi:hypothetical protein
MLELIREIDELAARRASAIEIGSSNCNLRHVHMHALTLAACTEWRRCGWRHCGRASLGHCSFSRGSDLQQVALNGGGMVHSTWAVPF